MKPAAFGDFTFSLLFAALLAFVAAGCSSPDPSEVSKENFARVVNEHLREEGACERSRATKGIHEFPVVVQKEALDGLSEQKKKLFEQAISAGVLSSEDTVAVGTIGPRSTRSGDPAPAIRYSRTEKGERYFRSTTAGMVRGERWLMCYGIPKVTEVTNYTEPTANQQLGMKLARVNYAYTVEDIPSWIAEGGYAGQVADEIDYWTGGDPKPKEGQEVLILSGNGWVHQSEFSQLAVSR